MPIPTVTLDSQPTTAQQSLLEAAKSCRDWLALHASGSARIGQYDAILIGRDLDLAIARVERERYA